MKRIFVFLGFAVLLLTSSCSKKAADVIVGHWQVEEVTGNYYSSYMFFQQYAVVEFDFDGTMRFVLNDEVSEGFYSVNGSTIQFSYLYNDESWKIVKMSDNQMAWNKGGLNIFFSRTSKSVFDNKYSISAKSEPFEGGEVTGAGYYSESSYCMLTAIANHGYVFTKWTEDGYEVSNESTYSFYVFSDRDLIANFEKDRFSIEASSNPSDGGYVTGGGYYDAYSNCTLTAVANSGYVFINWTEDNHEVSDDNTYSFTVIEDRHLVANFEKEYIPSQSIQFEWDNYVFQYEEVVECSNYDYDFDEFVLHMKIRNNSAEEKMIVIEKEVMQNDYGIANYFCWGMCYGPEVNTSFPVAVPAYGLNEEDLSFHAFFVDQAYGDAFVRYYAYEVNNPFERCCIIVYFSKW